jgi:hypothetical protein
MRATRAAGEGKILPPAAALAGGRQGIRLQKTHVLLGFWYWHAVC